MPRILRNSLAIDLHRIIATETREDLEKLLYDLLRELISLSKSKCRVYLSREPFTSNVLYGDEIYRVALGISSVIIECDRRELYSNMPATIRDRSYILAEDVWLRIRYFNPCVYNENQYIEPLLRELDISDKCRVRGSMRVVSRTPNIRAVAEKPSILFIDENMLEHREMILSRNQILLEPLSFLIDGVYTECVYATSTPKSYSLKQSYSLVAFDRLSKDPVIIEIMPDVFISFCTPKRHRDLFYLTLLLYLLTVEERSIELY
ncbi:MAG: hypothetical protein ABWJ42_06035, partial [Sulfolobales archaeon]